MDVRKKLGFFRMLGVWGEVRTLNQVLAQGEEVLAVGIGRSEGKGGLLAATNQRLLWVRMNGVAPESTTYAYREIKAVVATNELINGRMEFSGFGERLIVEQLDLRFARELKNAIDDQRRAV